MTIEQAIKKAIEGGWDDTNYAFTTSVENAASPNVKWEYDDKVFLDPSFWQSLGKALGWEKVMGFPIVVKWHGNNDTIPNWQYQWHRFIDHLASGKDAESFFTTLQ